MDTNIEAAEQHTDIEEEQRGALQLAFEVYHQDNPSFWRMLRRAEQENRRIQERLLKRLLRQNGRPVRPRKPAPHFRAALVARQKKARP